MNQTLITDIQLPLELGKSLEFNSARLKRERNQLVIEAISEYLDRLNRSSLSEEARRQSILASGQSHFSDEIWENNMDDTDWRQ